VAIPLQIQTPDFAESVRLKSLQELRSPGGVMSRKLGDWLDSYLEFTNNSEPPELFHIWTAISTVAAALQRKCIMNWGKLRFYPNMYIVLVAPSGKARKGTAMGYGKDFLSKLGVKMAAESITREALVREIMNAADSIINEETGEMSFHSSLTIFAPELVVFLGYNQQQLMMDLTDWYDCGHGPDGKWTYRTKTQGTDELTGVWVNMIGATTPELLRSCLSMDAIGGGLTSRIVFVYEEDKRKSCPAPFLSPEEQRLEEALYYDLEQIHLLKGQFKPSSDFIDLWVDWYVKQDRRVVFEDPHLAPYCERRPVHVMKLSIILNACRTEDMVVTSKDLQRAIDLLERTERKMPRTFSGIGKSPHAEVLSKVMTEVGLLGEVSISDLQRKFYHDADARVLDLIIQTLQSMGFITRTERGSETIIKYNKKEAC
jgi:hypothetical protein